MQVPVVIGRVSQTCCWCVGGCYQRLKLCWLMRPKASRLMDSAMHRKHTLEAATLTSITPHPAIHSHRPL